MFTKARTVTALFFVSIAASLAVALAAASSAGASPIDLLQQVKIQMQIQHQNYCSSLLDKNVADLQASLNPFNSAAQVDLAQDRITASNAGCPFV